MSNAPTAPQTADRQPKILHKMLVRFVIGLFVLALLVAGYQYLKTRGQDIDLPIHADTAGDIAAIQYLDRGAMAVVFEPNGTKRECPGYGKDTTDRDITWRPDGNRLFFVSDREKKTFHIFRWNLANDRVERRSAGTKAKFAPAFGGADSEDANDTALVIAGGFVLETTISNGHTVQVLPPVPREMAATDEGGVTGQFEALYARLGVSFRAAKWTPDKTHVAAVMRREDGTEMLIVQQIGMSKSDSGEARASGPIPVCAGQRIEFDISPVGNKVFFSVLEFMFPDPEKAPKEFIKNGRVIPPFRHALGYVDLSSSPPKTKFIGVSKDDSIAFQKVSVSPDGSMLLVVSGAYDGSGSLTPSQLLVMPADDSGYASASLVIRGKVSEPSWAPDSEHIAFVRLAENRRHSIYSIRRDGSEEKRITNDDGDYGSPRFSPQTGSAP